MKCKHIRYILVILFFCISLFSCKISDRDKAKPLAVKGVLDLRGRDLQSEGPINLSGEWEFYWLELINPDDFLQNIHPPMTSWFNLPGRWDNHVLDGSRLGGAGYATYRLRILLGSDTPLMAIRILNQSSAVQTGLPFFCFFLHEPGRSNSLNRRILSDYYFPEHALGAGIQL